MSIVLKLLTVVVQVEQPTESAARLIAKGTDSLPEILAPGALPRPQGVLHPLGAK